MSRAADREGGRRRRLMRLPGFGNLGYPIMLKELRALIRRRRFFWVQFIYLVLLGAGVLIAVASFLERSVAAQDITTKLASLFFQSQMFLVLLVFPAFAATTISGERVEGSYDLLITTDLRPAEIVWGKFLGALGNCSYFLVVTLPILGTCSVFGGVPVWDSLIGYGMLLGLGAVVSLYGIMVSAWVRHNVPAILLTYAPVFLLLVPLAIAVLKRAESGSGEVYRVLTEHPIAFAYSMTGALVLAIYFFIQAVSHLTSPEGNRHTPLRLFLFVTLATALAGAGIGLEIETSAATNQKSARQAIDALRNLSTALLPVLGLFLLSASSDIDTPLSVSRLGARRPAFARAFWLLLPGGARGLLYSGAMLALATLGLAFLAVRFGGTGDGQDVRYGVSAMEALVLQCALLGVGLFAYCTLSFLIGALGVKGAPRLVIASGMIVLANLLPVVQSGARESTQTFLRPVSLLHTLMDEPAADRFVAGVNASLCVHGGSALLLFVAGVWIARRRAKPLFGFGDRARWFRAAAARPVPRDTPPIAASAGHE